MSTIQPTVPRPDLAGEAPRRRRTGIGTDRPNWPLTVALIVCSLAVLVPLLVISQTIVLTVNVILGRGIIWSTVFYTALTSALVWPMLKIVLSRLFPAHRVPA